MEEKELYNQLNIMLERLQLTINEKGSLADPHVVAVSQEIDQLIVHLQRRRLLVRQPANS